jgi:peroxiredoxin Q/BCP
MINRLGLDGEHLSSNLSVGDYAPDFMLRNQADQRVRLTDLLRQGVVVLYFYPKDYSLGCTAEACAFRDRYEAFTEAGAIVVGVSADSTDSHREFVENYNLPFNLLSDEDDAIHERYGVRKTLGVFRGRVTFVIDQRGVIQNIFSSHINFSKHVTEALKVIQSLD